MNWSSEEGRELLWRAYPDGYIAMRGVHTVGGWTCIARPARLDVAVFRQLNDPMEVWVGADPDSASMSLVRSGDLLPLPDPGDPATWACMQANLAEAVNRRLELTRNKNARFTSKFCPQRGLLFTPTATGYWTLSDGALLYQWQCVTEGEGFPRLSEYPDEALVYVRIYEREWEQRAGQPANQWGGR